MKHRHIILGCKGIWWKKENDSGVKFVSLSEAIKAIEANGYVVGRP